MALFEDAVKAIQDIQNALNAVEVKGRQNAALLIFSIDRCGEVVRMLNAASAEQKNKEEETDHD